MNGETLRVVFVIPESGSKASMIFARRLADAVRRAGVDCFLFLLKSRTSARILLREWKRLRGVLKEFQPHLLHAQYGTMTAFFSAMAGWRPLVVTYRGSDLNRQPSASWPRFFAGMLLSQAAALRARRIICVSDELERKLWVGRSRASVIPSAVDTGVFYPMPREEARARLGWGRRERVALFNAGGDPAVKRLDLAQAAAAEARRICGEIRLAILDGEIAPERIPLMMNAADCLLLTSDSEGSPTVVQEAMACDLPVVSVDVGDVRQRLDRVRPSRIVSRDPAELGAALAEVLRSGTRSNGSRAIESLSCAAVARRTIQVYESALRRSFDTFLPVAQI